MVGADEGDGEGHASDGQRHQERYERRTAGTAADLAAGQAQRQAEPVHDTPAGAADGRVEGDTDASSTIRPSRMNTTRSAHAA